ncbi:MAG: TIGR01777 family protein [Pseudonocardiaceae bacterium]|nr:TIGR01777 family protein [Pseudonocardiaceae bacterium]
MRVLIAGSSGFIGSALAPALRHGGHEVLRLVRRAPVGTDERGWDPPAGRIDSGALDGVHAVINLCGRPLAPARWSAAHKQLIRDSRLEPTEVLAAAVAERGVPLLINASGAGFYGDTGETVVDESSGQGTGFLAELCRDWEAMTHPASDAGARVVRLRTGPVLAREGGLLGVLRVAFKAVLGARFGDGRQYLPWIHLDDLVAAIRFALEDDQLTGPVNLCAPNPARNAEFTRELGRALGRPTPWVAPAFVLRGLLGQQAEEMLVFGQRAKPAALLRREFPFRYPELPDALAAACA